MNLKLEMASTRHLKKLRLSSQSFVRCYFRSQQEILAIHANHDTISHECNVRIEENAAAHVKSVMSALEKFEEIKRKLEDEIEICSDKEVKNKKIAIVEKILNTIDNFYSEL